MATAKDVDMFEIDATIKSNDEKTLRELIAGGFDVNKQNRHGDTALHVALKSDAGYGILKLLIGSGANPEITNKRGESPLECINHSSIQTIENILKLETEYDLRSFEGNACLHTLMKFKNRVSSSEMSPFWDAIMANYEHSVFHFNSQNKKGDTPLMIATRTIIFPSISQHVKFILNSVNNLNVFIQNNDGDTFLHIFFRSLCVDTEIEITKQLMQGELNSCPKICIQKLLSVQNEVGDTPFLQFLQNLNGTIDVEILRLFVETGVNLNAKNIRGETVLHRVIIRSEGEFANEEENVEENIKYLVESGSNINAYDISGALPITLEHSPIAIKALIEAHADVNLPNKLGQTPLMLYTTFENAELEVTKILLEGGADINAKDNHNSTVLHYIAWEGGHIDMVRLLQTYGAKNSKDKIDQLPCHVAFYSRHQNVFDALCKCGSNEHNHAISNFAFTRKVTNLESLMTLDVEIIEQFKTFRGCLKSEVLNLPDIGRVLFDGECNLIKTFVYNLVINLCKEIASIDVVLANTMMESGSLGDNTKVGRPDEFDFVCIFSELSKLCEIDTKKRSEDPGFAYLKLGSKLENSESIYLFNEDGYLNTYLIWNKCQSLIKEYLLKPEIFNNSNATYCTYQRQPNYEIFRPTCRFTIMWSGPFYKNMEVNIDLVLACQIKGWWPEETTLCCLPYRLHTEVTGEGSILILQAKSTYMNMVKSHSRISALNAEKKFMNELPKLPRDAYVICKILCDDRICPEIRDENHDTNYQTCTDIITSYMLKTCMFHVWHEHYAKYFKKDAMKEDSYTEEDVHEFVVRILKTLLHFTNLENLPSFFFPKQNVFTFMMAGRDNVETVDDDDEDINHIFCTFRQIYIKFILALIGDLHDFKNIDVPCIKTHWKLVEQADTNLVDLSDYWEMKEAIENEMGSSSESIDENI